MNEELQEKIRLRMIAKYSQLMHHIASKIDDQGYCLSEIHLKTLKLAEKFEKEILKIMGIDDKRLKRKSR